MKEKLETPPNEPVLDLLLKLCAELPESNSNYFEGKFLEARHLARAGDLAGERNLYLALLQDPKLPDTFIVPTLKHLGASYELIPDYPKALETYKKLEALTGKNHQIGDPLLHAVFINLQQGNTKEALRIIQVLAGVDDATLKKSEDYDQIEELIALTRSGKAEDYWAHTAIWWPLWQNLAQGLGVSGANQTVIVPTIADLTEYGKTLGAAVRGNDPNAYFLAYTRGVNAARWLPSMALELATTAELSGQMALTKINDLRLFDIAQLEAAEFAGKTKDERRRHLMLAANYLDAGQADKALTVITAFKAQPKIQDAVDEAMDRIWGLVAQTLHKDYDAPVKALEADLQRGCSDRLSGVGVLADLYLAEGKGDDAQALLKRELADPKNQPDTAAYKALAEKSRRLIGDNAFAKQVVTWLKTNKPGWYDFAEPLDLKDPRLVNLDDVLKSPHPPFNVEEMTKLQFLVAQADGQTSEARRNAFNDAVGNLLDMSPTRAEARQVIDSIVTGNLFDDDVRGYWLWIGLFDAVAHRQKDDFAKWSADPLAAHFNPHQKEFLVLGRQYLDIDPASGPALMTFAKSLVTSPVDRLRLELLRHISRSLLRFGDVQDDQALSDGIPSWTLAPEVSTTKESLQLDWARQLDRYRASGTLEGDMAKAVLGHFPNPPAQEPAEYANLRNLNPLPMLGKEVTFQECLYLIKTGQFDQSRFSLWTDLLHSLPDDPQSAQFESDLVTLALKQAANDEQRSQVVDFASGAIDTDNPGKWKALQQSLLPYKQPAQPQTYSAIEGTEIRMALRTGKNIDLASAFSGMHQPGGEFSQTYVQLRQALAQQDHDNLTRLIDNLDSTQLLHPGLLKFTLPALDLLQMKTEAGLARQAAQKELNTAILISWATRNTSEVRVALNLATTLDKPDALPPAWVQEMSEKVTDPIVRWNVALVDAKLRKDWPNVFKASDQITQAYPTYYDYYWDKGLSLYQLGRKDEASQALTTYVTYCKDQVEYPQAVALLKTLGKPVPN